MSSSNICEDYTLIDEIKAVFNSFQICRQYEQFEQETVKELKSAALFNDVVVKDLVFYEGKWILYLMDTVKHFSNTCFLESNNINEFIRKISEIWL